MLTATQQLVAADVMERHLVTASPDDSLRHAMSLMTENHVTGLPVMDDHSRCIGLISSSDILHYEQERAGDLEFDRTAQFYDPETQRWEAVALSAFALEEFGHVSVSELMTRDLVWVERTTPITSVAQCMRDKRVHRVLVMDRNQFLYGIVSAYDLVRVLADE